MSRITKPNETTCILLGAALISATKNGAVIDSLFTRIPKCIGPICNRWIHVYTTEGKLVSGCRDQIVLNSDGKMPV